ncbi:MAG: diheme cytochrome c [Rhodospirillales bacterium]|nr:diheme cytochrome c [Rhodospirillales bacterium]
MVRPQLPRGSGPRMHARRKGRFRHLHVSPVRRTPMRLVATIAALSLALALASSLPAFASEVERVPAVTDATARKECGACHMAFQPALLPAETWKRLFAELPRHFGEDASLPEATRQTIEDYYTRNAGRPRDVGTLRISDLGWWRKEHRKVRETDWIHVKSKANCGACHKSAEQGWYEED